MLKERALEYVRDIELEYSRGKFRKWACASFCLIFGALIAFPLSTAAFRANKALFSRSGLDAAYDEFVGDTLISEAITDELFIIAYDYNNQEPRFYSKKFIELDPGVYNVSIGFASGASASMPGGFPPQVWRNDYKLKEVMIDGGVVANNPSLMARSLTRMNPKAQGKKVRIVSLSCGRGPRDPNKKADPTAFQKLSYVTEIFNYMTEIQQEVSDFYLGE